MATIVDVTILGNRYKLKSSDNEAGQLEELAARLDARMQETASHLKRVNPLNVSILTALQLAEELAKSHGEARAAYAKLQKQYNDELAQCKKDAAQLEEKQADELAKLRQDMAGLEKKHAEKMAQFRAEQAALGRKHADELARLADGQKESLSQLTRQHEALQAEHASLKKDYDELMELLEET